MRFSLCWNAPVCIASQLDIVGIYSCASTAVEKNWDLFCCYISPNFSDKTIPSSIFNSMSREDTVELSAQLARRKGRERIRQSFFIRGPQSHLVKVEFFIFILGNTTMWYYMLDHSDFIRRVNIDLICWSNKPGTGYSQDRREKWLHQK